MTKQQVAERIATMRRTSLMWAVTREGFVAQIMTMISIVYDTDIRSWGRKLVRMPVELAEPLDEVFAHKVCDSAMLLIAKLDSVPSTPVA